MHRDRGDAHLAAGAQDAQRDLAAVGDQDLVEHGRAYSMTSSGSPYSTGCRVVDEDLRRPCRPRGARIGFITFIASMISSVWPSLTCRRPARRGAAPGSGSQIDGADHGRA